MKPRKAILALTVAGLLGVGCSGGGPTIDPCEDVPELCPKEGVHRCSEAGTGFQTCQRDLNGCLAWSGTTSCGEKKICRSLGTDAACQCQHECTKEGATACSSDNKYVQRCSVHGSGCLVLETQTDCSAGGKTCWFSNNQAQCLEPCADQCPAGASRCTGDIVQICSRPERCAVWVDNQDCTLDGKKCLLESGRAVCRAPCQNRCSPADSTRCADNVIQVCATAPDGCLDWKDQTNCAQQDKYCSDAVQPAVCTDACQHQCNENQKRCKPTTQVIQTCTIDQNNCRLWQDGTDCALVSKICDPNNGDPRCVAVCQNQCQTENSTRCDQSEIQTCRKNISDGCLYWTTTGSCSGVTPLCDDSTGEALCQCQDLCPALGQRQCRGNVLDVCATDGDADPCLEWKLLEDCATAGTVCNPNFNPPACEAACTSNCVSSGARRCDQNKVWIQTCTAQGGCLIWVDETDCSAEQKTCDDSGAQPQCI